MESLWLLAILWAVLSFIGRLKGEKRTPEQQAPKGNRRPELAPQDQEGGVLEDPAEEWRREIERLLGIESEPARGPMGRPSPVELPGAEEVEEAESLEVEPVTVSLETVPDRPERLVRDQDEEVLPVLRKRLELAQARTAGRTMADHRRFDERIRRPAAPPPAATKGRPSLRQSIVWREILGPPVALRKTDQEF